MAASATKEHHVNWFAQSIFNLNCKSNNVKTYEDFIKLLGQGGLMITDLLFKLLKAPYYSMNSFIFSPYTSILILNFCHNFSAIDDVALDLHIRSSLGLSQEYYAFNLQMTIGCSDLAEYARSDVWTNCLDISEKLSPDLSYILERGCYFFLTRRYELEMYVKRHGDGVMVFSRIPLTAEYYREIDEKTRQKGYEVYNVTCWGEKINPNATCSIGAYTNSFTTTKLPKLQVLAAHVLQLSDKKHKRYEQYMYKKLRPMVYENELQIQDGCMAFNTELTVPPTKLNLKPIPVVQASEQQIVQVSKQPISNFR